MKQTYLGPTDIKVGCIAYGNWRFAGSTLEEADEKIRTALDYGMNLIDTADIYGFGEPAGFGGAEERLGEVLSMDKGLREKIVLATKGGIIPPRPYDSSYDYLIEALDNSLSRLRTNYVDLYQIHRPDLIVPFEEQARALNDIIKSGKARHVGVSNFTVSQTRALQAHLDAPLVSLQPEFSALEQSPMTDGILDYAGETRAAVLAWSPLAGGRLATGLASEGDDADRFGRVIDTIDKLASDHGASRSQIALAFTLRSQANVIPIIGTQNIDRIIESAASADIELTARDYYDLVEAYRGVGMP